MQEAAAVRGAALDAVDDVVPASLHDRLVDRFESGSMAPGVLTVLSARAVVSRTTDFEAGTSGGTDAPDTEAKGADFPAGAIAERGAGVQLIYEGLRLTRTLAREEPWASDVREFDHGDRNRIATNGHDSDRAPDSADMAILVADILVARGFYLLARTDAAAAAVSVVQSFGRDETVRRTTDDADVERALEADVFELAVIAGTAAVGGSPTPKLRSYVTDLARTGDRLPLADGLFCESTVETLAGFLSDEHTGSEGVATSADH